MRTQTIKTIEKEKLIVIVRGIERKKLIPLAEAMYNGGIRLLEVTYSANGKVSDEKTAENIRALVTHFGNKIYIEPQALCLLQDLRHHFASCIYFLLSLLKNLSTTSCLN